MSLQVGGRNGRTTGPGLWGQNKKTPPPDSPWANQVSDVFVVGGATAVGYLCRLLSEICANTSKPSRPYREQARSHTGFSVLKRSLWERACSR
jgi:hypothetical protein